MTEEKPKRGRPAKEETIKPIGFGQEGYDTLVNASIDESFQISKFQRDNSYVFHVQRYSLKNGDPVKTEDRTISIPKSQYIKMRDGKKFVSFEDYLTGVYGSKVKLINEPL